MWSKVLYTSDIAILRFLKVSSQKYLQLILFKILYLECLLNILKELLSLFMHKYINFKYDTITITRGQDIITERSDNYHENECIKLYSQFIESTAP